MSVQEDFRNVVRHVVNADLKMADALEQIAGILRKNPDDLLLVNESAETLEALAQTCRDSAARNQEHLLP